MQTVSVKVQIPDGWELACDEIRLLCDDSFYQLGDQGCIAASIGLRKVEPPRPDFKQGQIIEVSNTGNNWYLRRFSCWNEAGALCIDDGECVDSRFTARWLHWRLPQ